MEDQEKQPQNVALLGISFPSDSEFKDDPNVGQRFREQVQNKMADLVTRPEVKGNPEALTELNKVFKSLVGLDISNPRFDANSLKSQRSVIAEIDTHLNKFSADYNVSLSDQSDTKSTARQSPGVTPKSPISARAVAGAPRKVAAPTQPPSVAAGKVLSSTSQTDQKSSDAPAASAVTGTPSPIDKTITPGDSVTGTEYPRERVAEIFTKVTALKAEFETANAPYKGKIKETFSGKNAQTRSAYLRLLNQILRLSNEAIGRTGPENISLTANEIKKLEQGISTLEAVKSTVDKILVNPSIELSTDKTTGDTKLEHYQFDDATRERILLRLELKEKKKEYREILKEVASKPGDQATLDKLKQFEEDFLALRVKLGEVMQRAINRHAARMSTGEIDVSKRGEIDQKKIGENIQSKINRFDTALTAGLVISPARIRAEERVSALPEQKKRILGKLRSTLEKNRKNIQRVGKALVIGSIIAGSVTYFLRKGVMIVGDKLGLTGAVSAKLGSAVTATGLGAAAGALTGRGLGSLYERFTLRSSESAIRNASKNFKLSNLRQLEDQLSGKIYRANNAKDTKETLTLTGGIMGGVAGFIFAPDDADSATDALLNVCDSLEDVEDGVSGSVDTVNSLGADLPWVTGEVVPEADSAVADDFIGDSESIVDQTLEVPAAEPEVETQPELEVPETEPQPKPTAPTPTTDPELDNFLNPKLTIDNPPSPAPMPEDVPLPPALDSEPIEASPAPDNQTPEINLQEESVDVLPENDLKELQGETPTDSEPLVQKVEITNGNIDTVSEAFYEAWKAGNVEGLPEDISSKDFLSKMYSAIHTLDNNEKVMSFMDVKSGDLDVVQPGDKINIQPLIDHMNGLSVEEIEARIDAAPTAPSESLIPPPRPDLTEPTAEAPETSLNPPERPESLNQTPEIEEVPEAPSPESVPPGEEKMPQAPSPETDAKARWASATDNLATSAADTEPTLVSATKTFGEGNDEVTAVVPTTEVASFLNAQPAAVQEEWHARVTPEMSGEEQRALGDVIAARTEAIAYIDSALGSKTGHGLSAIGGESALEYRAAIESDTLPSLLNQKGITNAQPYAEIIIAMNEAKLLTASTLNECLENGFTDNKLQIEENGLGEKMLTVEIKKGIFGLASPKHIALSNQTYA